MTADRRPVVVVEAMEVAPRVVAADIAPSAPEPRARPEWVEDRPLTVWTSVRGLASREFLPVTVGVSLVLAGVVVPAVALPLAGAWLWWPALCAVALAVVLRRLGTVTVGGAPIEEERRPSGAGVNLSPGRGDTGVTVTATARDLPRGPRAITGGRVPLAPSGRRAIGR